MLATKCPNCGGDLVRCVMSPNEMYLADFGGVYCGRCDFAEQLELYYINYINKGIQQEGELENFERCLLENNKRLGIPVDSVKRLMKP